MPFASGALAIRSFSVVAASYTDWGDVMRAIVLCLGVLLSSSALATAKAPAHISRASQVVADARAPKGKLPDTATPLAYRLDFTVLPETTRFSGHDEIDITVNRPTRSLYMHGRDLLISKAVALVNGKSVPAKWTQVDK